MIFLELINPIKKSRCFLTVDESMTVGEFKKNLSKKMKINSTCIHMLTGMENVNDDMQIKETCMWNGSGVVIEDG